VPRIGLLAAGAFMLHTAAVVGQASSMPHYPVLAALSFAAYGLGFVLLGLGLAHPDPERAQWLILSAVLYAILTRYILAALTTLPTTMGTDSALFSGYAADLLLLGRNPYTYDMNGAYHAARVTNFFMTPRVDGAASTVLPYPAMHFLVLVPFRLVGLADLRVPYALAYAGAMVMIYARTPRFLRGVVMIPFAMLPVYLDYTLGWVSDVVWVLILLVMLCAWRRPVWRGVLFGLACAYKQTPWLLAPFILARLALDSEDADRRSPARRATAFAGWALLGFAAPNLPFILMDLPGWLAGVLEPVRAPLIIFGTGLSALSMQNVAALPRAFYSATSLIVLVGLLAVYVLFYPRLKHTLWLFPGIVLWFSYRSLSSYFVYWVPLLLMAAIEQMKEPPGAAAQLLPARVRQWALAAGGIGAIGIICALAITWRGSVSVLAVEVSDLAMNASLYEIEAMELTIRNTTGREVAPRIAVQQAGWQPYAWHIDSGPLTLAPGQQALYWVSTDVRYRRFSLADGAMVVVTDASGDYAVRGMARVTPDRSLLDPALYNTQYRAVLHQAVPYGWQLESTLPASDIRLGYDATAGFRTVELGLVTPDAVGTWESASLGQRVFYDAGDMLIWVRPPASASGADGPLQVAYGLEFSDDQQRRLWILFGPGTGQRALAENHQVVHVDAPVGVWSQQRVNPGAITEHLGWTPPPFQRVAVGDLELVTRTITLRLLLAARDQPGGTRISGEFGPLSLDPRPDSFARRTAEVVEDRWSYYLALSKVAAQERSFEQAGAYYAMAMRHAPPAARQSYLAGAQAALSAAPGSASIIADQAAAMALAYLQRSEYLRPDVTIVDWDQAALEQEMVYRGQGLPAEAAARLAARDVGDDLEQVIRQQAVFAMEPYPFLSPRFRLTPAVGLYRVDLAP
jgi:uncharacterized membrane protein